MTMRKASIAAIEYALPAHEITNDELDRLHPEWRMRDVVRRTGVESRRWCTLEETALDLGVTAAGQLLARLAMPTRAIDSVLFCTQTPDFVMPPNACLLQERLGLSTSVATLDFTHACSGFVYGLYLGKSLIESGAAENVLLVTAETYSKWISPEDRGPATLFGDGAAATLLSAGAGDISRVFLGTDGAAAGIFCVPAGGARAPRSAATASIVADRHGNARSADHLLMEGAAVLAFVQRAIPPFVEQMLLALGETWESIDLVVFHQASKVTLDALVARLRVPREKVFTNLARVGNTVSASIPIALRDAEQQGRIAPGARVLLVAFGVGMSWAGCLVTWPGRSVRHA